MNLIISLRLRLDCDELYEHYCCNRLLGFTIIRSLWTVLSQIDYQWKERAVRNNDFMRFLSGQARRLIKDRYFVIMTARTRGHLIPNDSSPAPPPSPAMIYKRSFVWTG